MEPTTQRRSACNRDCPDACGLIATVSDGRVIRLQGDPDHPVTQGFLCHRTSRFLDRQYAPDRLLRPLLRDGEMFREIDWQEALDLAAQQLLRFRAESGPASILHYRCGGSMGIMKHVTDYFFQCFGPVTIKSGDVCSGAGEAAQVTDFGCSDSHDLFDLRNSRTIVLWGKNVFVSSVHLIPLLRQARERGATVILIDPVHHRTASLCDHVLQPRPAGDAALACGIARWLFDHAAADPASSTYCDHGDAYRDLVMSRTVDQWAAIADVSPMALVQVAQAYARSRRDSDRMGITAAAVRRHDGTLYRCLGRRFRQLGDCGRRRLVLLPSSGGLRPVVLSAGTCSPDHLRAVARTGHPATTRAADPHGLGDRRESCGNVA